MKLWVANTSGVAFALLFGSGIGLVIDSAAIGWGTAFVLIGIGVVIVSGILEGAVFGPRLKRMAESDDNDIDGAARTQQVRCSQPPAALRICHLGNGVEVRTMKTWRIAYSDFSAVKEASSPALASVKNIRVLSS